MEMFGSVLMGIQVVSSLSIIILVLLQQGKGADMGSAFGSGSAGSMFGAAGAANFLSRATKWAAILFFASTIALAWTAHHPGGSVLDGGLMEGFEAEESSSSSSSSEVPGGAVPSAGQQDGESDSSEVPGLSDESAGDESGQALPELGAGDGADEE